MKTLFLSLFFAAMSLQAAATPAAVDAPDRDPEPLGSGSCAPWISSQLPSHWNEEIRLEVDNHFMLVVGRLWQQESTAFLFRGDPAGTSALDSAQSPRCEHLIEKVEVSLPESLAEVFDSARSLEFPLKAVSVFPDLEKRERTSPKWSLDIQLVNASLRATWRGCSDLENSAAGWTRGLLEEISDDFNPCPTESQRW